LQSIRHQKKLKRGSLSGNDFILIIRDWSGDKDRLAQILGAIQAEGVPNYFGKQRFGRAGQNVNKALRMFQGQRVKRQQRSIYLSAARSFLFNEILANRIQKQNWNQAVPGDTFIFDQSGSYFRAEQIDENIRSRLKAGAIHPTGVLWGKGETNVSADVMAIETAILQQYPALMQGLVNAAVAIGRRALRVKVINLHWQFVERTSLQLEFFLPAGSYATSVLREIIKV
jgi:tRNA pseudouridine13 synthase